MTEKQWERLLELQQYFMQGENKRERSIKLMELAALHILASTEDAESVEDIQEHAKAVLNVIKGV